MRDAEMLTNYNKDKSRHILRMSSNLLGICFVILNFFKLWKVGRIETIIVDKLIGITMVFFLIASILSYFSTRSHFNADKYEK